jgi:hypothetical protein
MNMIENLILLEISNKSTILMIRYGFGYYKNIFNFEKYSTCLELLAIFPTYVGLKSIMINVFYPLKPALHNLNKNICFLDIEEHPENIALIMSCDWCSICNGIFETAKQNIIKNPELILQINFDKLLKFDKILKNRNEKLNKLTIKNFCQTTFGTISKKLLLFSKIYLQLEMIESRWCPFKRSKELYYRNTNDKYFNPTDKMMYKIGKILSKHETITCNNCPKIINDNYEYTKSNKKSIFQPLLSHMIDEISKN